MLALTAAADGHNIRMFDQQQRIGDFVALSGGDKITLQLQRSIVGAAAEF